MAHVSSEKILPEMMHGEKRKAFRLHLAASSPFVKREASFLPRVLIFARDPILIALIVRRQCCRNELPRSPH